MLKGTHTAIVTPFTAGGEVDYSLFRDLVKKQIDAGVDGIVPVGTTGESPTLDFDEHNKVIETAIDAAKGKIKVTAGTGANATSEAIRLTKHAKEAGADATLQVTPYYNKPNQEGLIRHFSKVADIGLPVVLYNVPGRTGREIAVDTVVKLSEHPNIIAVKDAGGDVDRVSETIASCGITVLSGDDSMTLPMMAVGAAGVISVASNIAPDAVSRMTHLALDGKWDDARKLHLELFPLYRGMFMDTNPIPVKAGMAMMGLIEEVYRLPLCSMGDELKKKLRKILKQTGILA
ncbi:MAG: 4-hydroxy-tetrahydrodipicolinate synthase [Kiritimatiellia bacterium]